MKKIASFFSFVIACIILFMVLIPLVFVGKVSSIVEAQCDQRLLADVEFDKLKLNLFRDFPNVSVTLTNLMVVGVDTFRNDTLVKASNIRLTVNLKSILSDEGVNIKRISLENPHIYAKVLQDGRANWNITKPDTTPDLMDEDTSSSVQLQLKKITIKNACIVYDDRQSDILAVVDDWTGTLTGNLSSDRSLVETQSSIDALSFTMKKIPYLRKMKVEADIAVDADFKDSKYTLQTNHIKLNAMDVSLNGYIRMPDTSTVSMDLALNTEKVSFKELLSLIPAIYMKDFETVKTSGDLSFSAFVKGDMTETSVPAFDVTLKVVDASFRYPSLPAAVTDIGIDAHLTSTGGSMDNIRADVSRFHINMAGNPFDATLQLATPLSDPDFIASIKGLLDLGKIKEVYPLDEGVTIKGQINADLNVAARMSYFEKGLADKVKASGSATIKGMTFITPDMSPVEVKEGFLSLSQTAVRLQTLSLVIGQNDVQAVGQLGNYLPWLLRNETLKGSLNVTSNHLNLNDFLSKETDTEKEKDTVSMTAFQAPENLNLSLNVNAGNILFNKLVMRQVQGNLTINQGRVTLKNLSANALDGSIKVTGYYEALNSEKPAVDLQLNLQKVSFKETCKAFVMVQSLVPVFEKTEGNFSMNMQFNSLLDKHLSPDYMTLSGKGLLRSDNVKIAGVKALDLLATSLKMDQLKTIAPKNLNIPFSISKGRVHTSPFDLNVGQTKLNFSGSTGIDKTIDYAVKISLPSGFSQKGLSTLQGKIGGTFAKPVVKLDMADLAKQMVTGVADNLLKQMTGSTVGETVTKAKEDLSKKAEEIRAQAKAAGDNLIIEAEKQGNKLIEKANNPYLKAAAKISAEQLKTEAQKQAAALNAKAEEEIKKLK